MYDSEPWVGHRGAEGWAKPRVVVWYQLWIVVLVYEVRFVLVMQELEYRRTV
jgi:hypothetical protein